MKATILMLSLWMAKTQAQCPDSCNCTATSVSCVNQNLETVPNLSYLESTPVILDFSGNKILFIDEDDFDFPKSDDVKEIYLNNSGIADIGQGTFDSVENLQELYLGQNLLSSARVPANLIEELNNMVLLDISNNYFNGEMPTIKSGSLEVFVLLNSKITSIPENALEYLPKLKLLLLQQNNIQSISFEAFKSYVPNSFFMKLSFNSWTCSCDNLKAFYLLGSRKYIETSDPYKCTLNENETINIFNRNGDVELLNEQCDNDMDNELKTNFAGYREVRDMVNEDRKILKNLKPTIETPVSTFPDTSYDEYIDEDDDRELDIKEMNDDDLEAALPGNCWEVFTNAYSNRGFYKVVLVSIVVSFFIGFVAGLVFFKIFYILRYKKLEQTSDSQVQLLSP